MTDFINIEEDEIRERVLAMEENDPRMSEIATFVNGFPNITMSHELSESDIVAGNPTEIQITLEREVDEDEPVDTKVKTQFYPFPKSENCKFYIFMIIQLIPANYFLGWLVIGDNMKRELYGIKRVNVAKPVQTFKLEFMVPNDGQQDLIIWCVSDSYIDADEEIQFKVNVLPNDEDVEMEE